MWRVKTKRLLAAALLVVLCSGSTVLAQTSSSNSYQVNEYQFGSGGELDAASASFRAHSNVGALGVGRSSSTNYDVEGGFITPNEPFLELFVNNTTVDLGTLDTGSTKTGSGVFWVRTYVSSAYIVQTMSNPPTSEGGRVLAAKAAQGAPIVGTEEFGINLVANGGGLGADPFNVPDDSFADGQAATGYEQADQYKYGVGDIIARSAATAGNQAVGRTDYTISYIANLGPITPAGTYVMAHDIVVTPTY